MTVLGEFVLPSGGCAWTRSLVALMGQLGVRDKAARQAISRVEDQWLTRERVGRETRWTLTQQATDVLADGAERIYGFGRDTSEWDGRWVVVLASVPEKDRQRRYRMAQGLSWLGFGSLGNGTWISARPERELAAAELLRSLSVGASSFVGPLGHLGSGEELVNAAWNLGAVRSEYQAFLDDSSPSEIGDDEASAADLAALVHRWRGVPFLDPDLPAELLPADWPGPQAALRFETERARLGPAARRWWNDIERR